MNKIIVTTTIYPPSEATMKFVNMKDWKFIIVGDLKTPHDLYFDLMNDHDNVLYLHPEYQETQYLELSEAIGWNKVMRRNIGFVEAYNLGAEIVASIDDDNIPYDDWGQTILVGQNINTNLYLTDNVAFNPLTPTNHNEIWHRGFPIQLVSDMDNVTHPRKLYNRKVLFQADLWDGDPDIDAMYRILYNPTDLKLTVNHHYSSNSYIPFNSQNTFIAREALPYYMVLPYVGRMDDIWGGYIAQYLLNTRPVFCPATVYQDRNNQDLNKNFLDEVLGYTTTLKLLQDIENWEKYLPEQALNAYKVYRNEYKKINQNS